MITEIFLIQILLNVLTAESDHFIFSYAEKDAGLVRHFEKKTESIRREIVDTIGHDSPDKTRIILVGPEEPPDPPLPPGTWIPPWAAAVAYPGKDLILVRVRGPRGGRPSTPEVTLTHELTHIILGKATGRRPIPRWLNEGLAMFLARQWNFSHTFAVFKAALTGRVPSLAYLDRLFEGSEGDIRLAYGLSFSFIAYLLDSYDRESLHLWIRLIGRGRPWRSAFSRAFPSALTEAEAGWRRRLKIRFAWAPFIFSGTGIWFGLTLLFLLGYLARRRRDRTIMERWRAEEGYYLEEREDLPPPPSIH